MNPTYAWKPAVLAASLVLALAAPAWGHGGAPTERHGDPVAQFKDGSDEIAEAPGPPTSRAASPTICTTVDSTVNDTANDPHAGSGPVTKVIYAHPSDVGNRIAGYGPVIQAGIKSVSEIVAAESGGATSLRFDIGTFEGPHCLDLQRVALSQARSHYSSGGVDGAFPAIAGEVMAALGPQGATPVNYLIYADLVTPAGVAGAGEASISSGVTDTPGSGAIHNQGGYVSQLYGRGGTDFFGSATSFPAGTTSRYQADVALHEVTHNLGGVQLSAPNSSGAGHCNDLEDLMCYEDGGPGSLYIDSACDGASSLPADPYGSEAAAWDCNKDDYFNPSPASGSYLATHWNIADSSFLCPVAACTPPDLQRPSTSFISAPKKLVRKQVVKVRFRASERSSFRCRLDRGKPRPCGSPFKAKVRPGKHRIVVTATDRAGNADLSPAKAKFRFRARR